MSAMLEPHRCKIAKRVIEVFEFFTDETPTATVGDIVRRYGYPQSSTSELLGTLAEMGWLYKDPLTRSYSPTPRVATLGRAVQPEILRDGRIDRFINGLAQSTRQAVALFGMVGTHVQIFRWVAGAEMNHRDIDTGASELLSTSSAGHLLMSTLGAGNARKLLWRLHAEARHEEKFDYAELSDRVIRVGAQRCATGPAGFLGGITATSVLLPCRLNERPLALGVIYSDTANIDSSALIATLTHGVAQCVAPGGGDGASSAAPLMRVV